MHYFKIIGNKENWKSLWENEEALNKYLKRLKELMEADNEKPMTPFTIEIDGKTIKGEFTNLSSAAGGFYTFQILINKYFIGNLEFREGEWKFQSYNNKRMPTVSENELAKKIGEIIAVWNG